MPKKRSSSSPTIMQRVTNLLKISILLAKVRGPIITRFKLSLKNQRKLKRFKLLKHYNYGYIQEYEYSPSSTPLIRRCYRKRSRVLDSMLLISKCLGALRGETEDEMAPDFVSGFGALPSAKVDNVFGENDDDVVDGDGDDDDGENSIDERAEEFIERFYEEMRLQRQESVMKQFDALVDA